MSAFVGFRRYLLHRDFPRRLLYRSAAIELELVPASGDPRAAWEFRARKLQLHATTCTIWSSLAGKWRLEQELFHEGFVMKNTEPAARIMERLVHEGAAQAVWCRENGR